MMFHELLYRFCWQMDLTPIIEYNVLLVCHDLTFTKVGLRLWSEGAQCYLIQRQHSNMEAIIRRELGLIRLKKVK